MKLGGIGATGIAQRRAGRRIARRTWSSTPAWSPGGANLLNLFDLRPGRAIKVAVASGAMIGAARPGRRRAPPLPPLAAALALLPEDLGERAMLGDAGANALGAMLGASAAGPAAARPDRAARRDRRA